jgi:quercetin dioxygenase-like cupin family protein
LLPAVLDGSVHPGKVFDQTVALEETPWATHHGRPGTLKVLVPSWLIAIRIRELEDDVKIIEPQTAKGAAEWFTGDVHPTIVLSGEEPSRVRMGSVHFPPGARTAWHSHAVGQYLHIVEGKALLQERGGDVVELHPGQTVYTGPGLEHWHGATPDTFMVHLAVWEAPAPDGATPEISWAEHVIDAEYARRPITTGR